MAELKTVVAEEVKWLSGIGADPTGGTTRLLYDQQWREAQKGLVEKFQKIGLTTSFDAVGNFVRVRFLGLSIPMKQL